MTISSVASAAVWEDSTPILLARLERADGADKTPVLIADISTVTYTVRESLDTDTEIVGGTLTKGDVWFDTLQVGDLWTKDTTGFNFKYVLEAAAIPDAEKEYYADLTLTLTDGTVEKWRYKLDTEAHYT